MIEPLTPIPLPRSGFASGMPYNNSSADFTHECLNVMPFDTYEDKLRISTRQGVTSLIAKTTIDSGTGDIQFLQYFKVYDANGILKDGLIAIVDGIFKYTNTVNGTTGWTNMAHESGSPSAGTQEYPCDTTGAHDNKIQGVQLGDTIFFACTTEQDTSPAPEYFKVNLKSGTANAPTYEAWLPTAAADHALPACADQNDSTPTAGSGATIITAFGSRIVLSGQPSHPTNWYMSGLPDGDNVLGRNWKYSISSTTEAIAGNSGTKFAELGDNIVGMRPFGSGGLLFGCTNSMVLLTQDPAFDNAEFKPLSNSVGLVGKEAFVNSTGRSLFFVGTDGMYQVDENAFSIDESNKISDGRLDDAFDQTKWNETRVTMGYDQGRQGIWVFLTRTQQPLNSVHYFYHIPTQSFWPQVFNDPDFTGPTVLATVRPDNLKTLYLMMANDTKICRFSDVAFFGSDGYPDADTSLTTPSWDTFFQGYIQSYVKIGPIYNNQRRRTTIKSIEIDMDIEEYQVPQLDTGTGPAAGTDVYPVPPTVDLFLSSGETPEDARGSALRNIVLMQIVDTADLRGTSWDTTDGWVNESGNSGTALNGSVWNGSTAFTESDGSTLNVTHTIDGNVDICEGEYTVTNPFKEGQDRAYEGPDGATLTYDSSDNYWKIKISTTVQFRSNATNLINPTDADYFDDQTTTLDALYQTQAIVTGSPAPTYSVKNLGKLAEGRSNRKNCSITAPAHYIVVQGLGRPIILESVAAHMTDGGPNQKNTQTVVQ
tara:strand:+ start:1187 stop:3481 length:2295 start_codon:yes stop_codon:yes gene_type:complete